MLLKIVLMVFNKSLNEDPRLLAIIHGMPMMRIPFTQEEAEARSRTPLNLWLEAQRIMGTQEEARSRTPLSMKRRDLFNMSIPF